MDRLGRSPAEVLETLVDVGDRGLALRSLREDLDTRTAVGHVVVGVLASLGMLEREARRERGQHVGRPRALTAAADRCCPPLRQWRVCRQFGPKRWA